MRVRGYCVVLAWFFRGSCVVLALFLRCLHVRALASLLWPRYVKAWARKGDIDVLHKEYHKAMDS